jgi:hypothetical protein
MRATGLALALMAATLDAAGQSTVYRCGPDGRVFSQAPCADGHAVPIAPGPSARASAEARAVADREARLARQWADERRAREAQRARETPRPVRVAAARAPAARDDERETVNRPSRRAKVPAAAGPASGR